MGDKLIKLTAIGDIALTHHYDKLLLQKGPDYPFENVRQIFSESDVVFCNLESSLSGRGENYPLKCSLRSDPDYIKGIKNSGINVVSLANNHVLDFQEDAFYDTLDLLNQYGINYFGAGKDLDDARKPLILNIKNQKIGFLGYCDVIIDSPFYASKRGRGIAPLKLEFVEEDIADLKKNTDVIIISLHWGIENWHYPSPEQVSMAHQIIDLGSNMILGHHPHVLQGVEKYHNGFIAYSLGNFIFCDILWSWINKNGDEVHSRVKLNADNKETVILSAEICKDRAMDIKLTPCVLTDNHQPEISDEKILKKMSKLSGKFIMSDYSVFWKRYVYMQKIKILIAKIIKLFKKLKKVHRINIFSKFKKNHVRA